MAPVALNLHKLAFIGVLYVFLWQVVRAVRVQLAGAGAAAGVPELVLTQGTSPSGTSYRVSGALIIGRSPDADVVLDDQYASDFHLRIGPRAGEIRLQDLGSTNGTFVNDARVEVPLGLHPGDRIRVGETIMELR